MNASCIMLFIAKHNDYIFSNNLIVNLPIGALKNILKIFMVEILVLSQS